MQNYLVQQLSPIVIPASITARVVPVDREAVVVYINLDVGDVTLAHIPMNFSYINGNRLY